MAEIAGCTNLVYVLTGAVAMTNSTGAKVLGVDNSTFTKLCEMLDVTQFGDTYRNRMGGLKDSSLSLSGNYYPGDTTGQDELVPGDSIYIGTYPSGSASAGTQIPAIVESFEVTAAVDGKQEFSCSIQGKGAPVELPAQS